MTNVVIASAARTAVGSFGGSFANTPAHDVCPPTDTAGCATTTTTRASAAYRHRKCGAQTMCARRRAPTCRGGGAAAHTAVMPRHCARQARRAAPRQHKRRARHAGRTQHVFQLQQQWPDNDTHDAAGGGGGGAAGGTTS